MSLALKADGLPDYPVPPSPLGDLVDPDWEVEPEDVRRKLELRNDSFVLLDCRRPHELELARIAGSVHMQMEQMPAHREEIEALADRDVVVYCHHGKRSLRVAAFMRSCGCTSVKSMAGGIDRWSQEIDPDVPVY